VNTGAKSGDFEGTAEAQTIAPDALKVSLEEVIALALDYKASDIHLKAGQPPTFRIDGHLKTLAGLPSFSPEHLTGSLMGMLNRRQQKLFEENLELDTAFMFPGRARVRVNIYTDIESLGCAMRIVPLRIPTMDDLLLPPVVEKLTHLRSGLILVTGATGAGKSTTLASMVGEINRRDAVHIYSIEDPIEYVHRPVRSVITQREIGYSTKSFSAAVRSALRADPNVLLIGEMRDAETILAALKAAETGLLVLSTLHTSSATKTIQRILGIFEPAEQEAIRMQLAYALKAVICQQLLPLADGGRRAFHEIMINTPTIQEAILFGDLDKLSEFIKNGAYDGMCSMDGSIYQAYCDGLIESQVAREFSIQRDEMERALRGAMMS
jgi:twitching motility protein PilT